MKSMHEYKKLRVWNEAMDLVKDIYVISGFFPESEKFGIVKQIKRSAVYIPSNIAEGTIEIPPVSSRIFWGLLTVQFVNWKHNY